MTTKIKQIKIQKSGYPEGVIMPIGVDGKYIDTDATHRVVTDSQITTWNNKPNNKSDIGLSNVTNDAQVKRSEMGKANGVATLGNDGKVPSSQLPSYVDDVIEVSTYNQLPVKGETGKIYVTTDTNKTYRWSGTTYVVISDMIALGTTSSTAYPGSSGATNRTEITKIKDGTTKVPKAAYSDATGAVSWSNVTDKPGSFTPSSHTHDDRYYTEAEINNKLANKVSNFTATASVSNTTGTPEVKITKGGTVTNPTYDFAFTNLKGATGAQGPRGNTGATGSQGIQGKTGPIGKTGPSIKIFNTSYSYSDSGMNAFIAPGYTGVWSVSPSSTSSDRIGDVVGLNVMNTSRGANTIIFGEIVSGVGTSSLNIKTVGYIHSGAKGEQGIQGKTGNTGPRGEQGPAGKDGATGAKGATGDRGPAGSNGISCTHSWSGSKLTITSASGSSTADLRGPQGIQGKTGNTGPQGKTGPAGKDGLYAIMEVENDTLVISYTS